MEWRSLGENEEIPTSEYHQEFYYGIKSLALHTFFVQSCFYYKVEKFQEEIWPLDGPDGELLVIRL